MRKIIVLLIPVVFLGASCNFRQEPKNDNKETIKILEENKAKLEAYKLELSEICTKPIASITAVEVAKCKDFKENSWLYEFIFTDKDQYFSYLPEFCKRKVEELTANELAECLQDKPDEDDNPFE